MDVSTSRGKLLLGPTGREYDADKPATAPPLTQPLDDLLGVRLEDIAADGPSPYSDHLLRYRRFWPSPGPAHDADELVAWHDAWRDQWREWMVEAAPRFLLAAQAAESGRISALIAPDIERVTFKSGVSPDSVPDGDFPALAAWCLLEALRQHPMSLAACNGCQRPWLKTTGHDYCLRPRPGHTRTCREIAKEAAFLSSDETKGYRREYKRLHERKRRGAISTAQLNAWRQMNGPAAWKPYEDWVVEQADAKHNDKEVSGDA